MRLPIALVMAGLLSGCSTMSSWMDGITGGDDNSVQPAELQDIEASVRLVRRWDRDIGAGTDGQFVNLRPALEGDRLYIADRKGRVLALDARDGKQLWSVSTDLPLSAGPGIGAGLVILGSSNADILALDADDGSLRWQSRARSEILSIPRVDIEKVIVQTVDGSIAGLSLEDGSQQWINSRDVPVLTLRGTATPVLLRGLVMAGFATGKLAAYSADKGFPVWEESVAIPKGRSELERIVDIDGDMAIDDTGVFVTSYQGHVTRRDPQSGNQIWEREMSSSTGLSIDYSQVYITDQDSHVWSLSRSTGATSWRQDALEHRDLTVPEPYGSYVVVGDNAGYLHVLSRTNGSIVGRSELDNKGIRARPLVAGELIYVYGNSGRLAAYIIETL